MGSPSIPDPIDPSVAAIAGIKADLANYPFQYAIDAAAKTGGKWTDPVTGKVYDFTGLGDADSAAKLSDQMAQTLLDIQKNTAPAFIKQRLADLQQSDPAGYAARKQLFDKIMADADAHPNRPIAEDLQNQITGLLNQGGKLDAKETEQVQQGVRGGQVARGLYLGNAPASEEASAVVNAGDAVRDQRQAAASNFLASGVSPQDVEYRRIQQSLSNLGSFVNGTSPTAQFSQLSGAQNGAAPFTSSGNVGVTTNPNAAQMGINFNNSLYQSNANYQNSQVNPFVAGLTTAMGGVRTAANLGAFSPTPAYNVPASNMTTFASQTF